MRYDQWSIKYSIAMKGRSPTLYDFLRRHDLLTLPCKKTLLAYTGRTKGQVGITNVNAARLQMIFQSLTHINERRISIEIDEMQCRSLMLWIQSRQEFVGKIDFGEVKVNGMIEKCYGNQEEEQEIHETLGQGIDCDGGNISKGAICQVNEGSCTLSDKNPVLANSLINFIMTGLTTKFTAIVGSWPVAKLAGQQLFFLTVHVIKKLEEIGFIVDGVVGDNARINIKLFDLLRHPSDKQDFIVTHPVNPSIPLFLSYDYTHLIKNIRNQLIDRKLTVDGKKIYFGLVRLLLERTMNDHFHIARFLTRKHVNPTNFERMKVNFAVDLFRPELVASLRTMHDLYERGFESVEPLCEFLEKFWMWFCYHDVSNWTQHSRQRIEIRKPFSDIDDDRLDELNDTFSQYLEEW